MRGRYEHRPVWRHEAAHNRPARFHQLGRDHDIDLSRQGRQAQNGRLAAGSRPLLGEQLHIIHRGAATLGHAAFQRGLREETAPLRGVREPRRKCGPAFAAHAQDGDLDRLQLAHPPAPAKEAAGLSRRRWK